MTPAATQDDIALRLDRLPVTALHLLAVGLCAVGFALDTFELALGGILAAVFSAPAHALPARELSLLLASVYIGATIGAPLLGWLADRFGRRQLLMVLMLGLGAASLASALSPSPALLALCRGLGGVALGAYPPIVIAYLTDLVPPTRRGMLIFAMVAFASLGPPAGIFLVRFLTPLQPLGLEAWRWGFLAGGVGTAIVGALFRLLPESPRWLQARGREAQAEAAFARLQQSRTMLAAVPRPVPAKAVGDDPVRPCALHQAVVAGIFLLSPWATVAFPILSGAVLAQKGYQLSDTLLVLGLSWFGPLIGTLLASSSVDRLERRVALCLCAVAMVAAGGLFVIGDGAAWLAATSIAFTLASALYVPTLTMYSAELFPTAARARSLAAAWAFNRIGAAIAPMLLLPLLHSAGATAMFGVVALTLLGSLLLLGVAPRGRQRMPVR
ncbi:MFS transporter [Paucibacter sp. R3-3]|uniref:MFS transporter n=1 Tax=Roseateles agri TaxID=3098619 RepID=A0ABU5DJ77_9BURK|nr:MFS transporter [Paucibacter sp. R3-3]MDY0746353.1 MFS transporter [Paucibacter sp. R3-3]